MSLKCITLVSESPEGQGLYEFPNQIVSRVTHPVSSHSFSLTPSYPSLQPLKVTWVEAPPAHKNANVHIKVIPIVVNKFPLLGGYQSNVGFHEEDNSLFPSSCNFVS